MRPSPPFSNLSTKSRRVKLVVAYDGTDFCGWAAQTGRRTVQSTLKIAVRQVSGEDCEIIGASRTDGGAHALGQVCAFETTRPIPAENWAYALNRVLPPDVLVKKATFVGTTFHPRFSAIHRHYRYRILNATRDPHRARFVQPYPNRPLDVDAMHAAAQWLVGEHDFRAFSEEFEADANAVRTLFSVQVSRKRDEVWIDVVGSAFVRGMMRRISGGLLELGRGHRSYKDWKALLDMEARQKVTWPEVLPACGLTLIKIRYGGRPFHGDFR